jgi:hypothetical protein
MELALPLATARMTRTVCGEDATFRTAAAFGFALVVAVVPANAADRDNRAAVEETTATAAASTTTPLAAESDWSLRPVRLGKASRGGLLPSLYVSLAGLNAFDAYTTSKGLSMGAVEANPMMRTVAGNPAVLWAVKGGVTAGSVFLAERMWKTNNKAGAIAVMLATNSVMATVAARNASVIRQLR